MMELWLMWPKLKWLRQRIGKFVISTPPNYDVNEFRPINRVFIGIQHYDIFEARQGYRFFVFFPTISLHTNVYCDGLP